MFSRTHLALRVVRLKSPEKWVTEPNQMLFVFPKAGSGRCVSPVATQHLSPGDVLILNSTCQSEVCSSNGGEFAFCFFSVCPEHIFPLFGSSELSLLRNISEGFKATKVYGGATELARECHQLLAEMPPVANLEHRGQLLRVVAAIFETEVKTVQPHLPGFVRAEDHMRQVVEKVSADDLINSSVGELAARFGWSKRHLNRMFHSYFGLSAAAMKMEMRLLRALSLLRDPDVKIISVAELCGFNYLGFFNTCFKKRFGVTPSQRRRMMAEADGQSRLLGGRDQGPICPLRSLGLACRWAAQPVDHQAHEADGVEPRKARRAKPVLTAASAGGGQRPARVACLPTEPSLCTPLAAAQAGVANHAPAPLAASR